MATRKAIKVLYKLCEEAPPLSILVTILTENVPLRVSTWQHRIPFLNPWYEVNEQYDDRTSRKLPEDMFIKKKISIFYPIHVVAGVKRTYFPSLM